MQLSRNWLADYVDLPSDEELAHRLTFAGLAVEGEEVVGDDLVLDVDVTTNRPDAMSHFGLARELAVLTGKPLRCPETETGEVGESAAKAIQVRLDDPEGCPRYVARVVRGVTVGESPEWLRNRLETLGLRPINNVVDVTNFVLWETGQPLHAFDLAKIGGATIRVRRPEKGETLVTLDEEERELTPEMLIIADAEKPVALAGVMGGFDSEVTAETRDVLVESAHFHPVRVRRTAGALGMHTDASHRFERGSDPGACRWAADRAARLIAEVAGGEVLAGAVDAQAELPKPRRGRLELEKLRRFAGAEIQAEEVERILTGLGFELHADEGGTGDGGPSWTVTVPTWRTYDFDPRPQPPHEIYPADLYEEVLRIRGFETIPSTLPSISGSDGPRTEVQRLRDLLRDHLSGCGYAEAINLAFHSSTEDARYPALRLDGAPVKLANPLSERYDVLRRSLVPNLIENARFNRRRAADWVALYEIGHVFYQPEVDTVGGVGRSRDTEVDERETVALILGGRRGTPWDRPVELDLFDLKGALESVAEILGVGLEARPTTLSGLVPGTAAELWVDGVRAGFLGRVAEEEPEYPLFVAELATAVLRQARRAPDGGSLAIEVPSRFPAISVDLTLTHPLEVSWSEMTEAIEENRPEDLVQFGLENRYHGPGVPDGAVNTTIYFLYNSPERSLTQDEVNERQERLRAELDRRFGWRD